MTLMAGGGVAYYMGDLSGPVSGRNWGLGPNFALGGSYRLSNHLSVRSELRYYRVSGHQKYTRNYFNNLSFRTQNPDYYIGLQADLLPFDRQSPLNAHFFGGVGATYLSPQAQLDNTWHSLAPLRTEAVAYNRLPILWIAGVGVTGRLSEKTRLGLELCNMFVQSDYLDDVSTVYPDPSQLTSELAIRLSDRAGEIGERSPQPGWTRGNPKRKDSYLFVSLKLFQQIGSRSYLLERRKTRCP